MLHSILYYLHIQLFVGCTPVRKSLRDVTCLIKLNSLHKRFLRFQAWFLYRCICRTCRVCRTKKILRTDRIHLLQKVVSVIFVVLSSCTGGFHKVVSVLWFFFVRQTQKVRQIERYGNQASVTNDLLPYCVFDWHLKVYFLSYILINNCYRYGQRTLDGLFRLLKGYWQIAAHWQDYLRTERLMRYSARR